MSGLVETVRKQVEKDCVKNKGLRREGCSVSLKDAPKPHLTIDFDRPGSPLGQRQIRCDYLFVADDTDKSGWVVPLELKSGMIKASTVVKQLNAGARVAERFVPQQKSVNFRPVLASGGGIHKAERKVLKAERSKVQFHGTAEHIRLIKCGSKLIQGIWP